MKKALSILAGMLLICSTGVFAQSSDYPKHEISVGYGAVGATDMVAIFGDGIVGALTGNIDEINTTGEITAQYLCNLNKTWGIGVGATFTETEGKDDKGTYKQTSDYIIVMPTVRANWFRNNYFGMYSRVAAGAYVSFDSATQTKDGKEAEDSSNDAGFAFQVSPIGIEIGSRNLCGYIEGGFGYQGLIMAGLRLGF